MFAKRISPLVVPMETIILNTRRKSTRATPVAASRKNSRIYVLVSTVCIWIHQKLGCIAFSAGSTYDHISIMIALVVATVKGEAGTPQFAVIKWAVRVID